MAFAAALDCAVHAADAAANTERAAAVGYLCFSISLFACALAFFHRARSAQGTMRIRWSLIAAGTLLSSLAFVPSFTEVIFSTGPARLLQTPCFNVSEALFLLAIVLFCSGASRSVVLVDLLQALLFVVLRFNLVYSPATRDHFTHNHLLISQLMALFLFLIAVVARLGAVSRAEVQFLRTLAWFFGLRLVAYFTADQVSYVWLHHLHSSLWDVPGTALLSGYALYLFFTGRQADAQDRMTALLNPPSLIVRNLLPAFLALANVMLGLFVLPVSVTLAAVVISLSVVSYALRTSLFQAFAAKEQALLESRNEHLENLAVRDPLTGIGNRRSLAEIYNRMRATSGDQNLSLLLLDIDRFKQANDSHGHIYGDRILVALAKKLEALTSRVAGSHSSRLGGDEFALLLPGISPQQASDYAEDLRSQFEAQQFSTDSGIVSLSIGVASVRQVSDLPLEGLISSADRALYRAKLLGRNRVHANPLFEPIPARQPLHRRRLQKTAS